MHTPIPSPCPQIPGERDFQGKTRLGHSGLQRGLRRARSLPVLSQWPPPLSLGGQLLHLVALESSVSSTLPGDPHLWFAPREALGFCVGSVSSYGPTGEGVVPRRL